jgi:FMN phosphatase YigB (HAD superfamily)
MEVRQCFERLYGPNLLESFKDGPEFYRQIFADAGVPPEDALAVDDNPVALDWASQAGARTVLVGEEDAMSARSDQIGSLAELPAFLSSLMIVNARNR